MKKNDEGTGRAFKKHETRGTKQSARKRFTVNEKQKQKKGRFTVKNVKQLIKRALKVSFNRGKQWQGKTILVLRTSN